jgi:polar amino acid transport system substrate-binding protein
MASRHVLRPALLLTVIFASVLGTASAQTGTDSAPHQPTLRVATGRQAPFVIDENGTLSGFSIDLWQEIARRLGRDFVWLNVGTSNQQLAAVAGGDADVAIAAITMTPEREQRVDFSTSYFDSGLQIMVPAQPGAPFLSALGALFSPAIRALAFSVIAIVFILANVLWVVERRTNPAFQRGYLRGVLEGCWGVMLIVSSGEYRDPAAANVARRLTVSAMWLLGVVLIAQFTATVTSSLTIQQLHSSIEGPGDLPGKKIGTVSGTVVADYLQHIGADVVPVTSADHGFAMLKSGAVQAIVFDAPTLQYWAAKRGKGLVEVVGPIFRPEKYGIGVAQGSPLRKQINEALLALYDDGKYDEIRAKWFAPSG